MMRDDKVHPMSYDLARETFAGEMSDEEIRKLSEGYIRNERAIFAQQRDLRREYRARVEERLEALRSVGDAELIALADKTADDMMAVGPQRTPVSEALYVSQIILNYVAYKRGMMKHGFMTEPRRDLYDWIDREFSRPGGCIERP